MTRGPARTIATVGVAVALLGCDALVGGECAPGFQAHGGVCVPTPIESGGDAGGSSSGTGGAGGSGVAGGEQGGGDAEGSSSGTGGAGGEGGATGCAPSLTSCGDLCVDLSADPLHCGTCGNTCATGLCLDGFCEGDAAGHAVVIGMSYEESTPASRRLFGNALFLPLADPLLIVDYRQHTEPAAAEAVDLATSEQALLRNRGFERFVASDPAEAATELASGLYDVMLVHDQALASAATMAIAGEVLGPTILSFAQGGGVVVVLASDEGPGMADFLATSGVLATTGLLPIDGHLFHVAAPTDALAVGVTGPFVASTSSAAFILDAPTSTALVSVVTAAPTGDSVVLHRIYLP